MLPGAAKVSFLELFCHLGLEKCLSWNYCHLGLQKCLSRDYFVTWSWISVFARILLSLGAGKVPFPGLFCHPGVEKCLSQDYFVTRGWTSAFPRIILSLGDAELPAQCFNSALNNSPSCHFLGKKNSSSRSLGICVRFLWEKLGVFTPAPSKCS